MAQQTVDDTAVMLGTGTSWTCRQWVQARQDDPLHDPEPAAWVLGFLSGVAAECFDKIHIGEARLVLTEALIRETLRAAKAAREAAGEPDDEQEEENVAGDEAGPRRGPGRFAQRRKAPPHGGKKFNPAKAAQPGARSSR